MDLLFIELLLWGGLIFFFWALKDGLGQVESDIESMGMFPGFGKTMYGWSKPHFVEPEQVREPIGSYQGATIHRYAVIDGATYQFDRVCLPENMGVLDFDECFIAPGLVYQKCMEQVMPS